MGRSKETFNKKEVRKKKEKKRKDKEKRRIEKKDNEKSNSLDNMIAYVDEYGNITSTPPDPDKKEEIDAENIEVSIPKNDHSNQSDPVRRGTVSFYNDSKGYGFIRDSETKETVFFHVNNTAEDVIEGNLVSFEVEKGPKGPAATRVKLIR